MLIGQARDLLAIDSREARLTRYGQGHWRGRPRERWRVTDYPGRIDAGHVRRLALAAGHRLDTVRSVTVGGTDAEPGEPVAVVAVRGRAGVRLLLVCPRCWSRRVHLYAVRAGVRCRACAGIGYADRRRGRAR